MIMIFLDLSLSNNATTLVRAVFPFCTWSNNRNNNNNLQIRRLILSTCS